MSASAAFENLRRDHRPVRHGAFEMCADVQRGVDALRHDHLRLQVPRVVHLVCTQPTRKGDMASLPLDYLVNRGVVVDISRT